MIAKAQVSGPHNVSRGWMVCYLYFPGRFCLERFLLSILQVSAAGCQAGVSCRQSSAKQIVGEQVWLHERAAMHLQGQLAQNSDAHAMDHVSRCIQIHSYTHMYIMKLAGTMITIYIVSEGEKSSQS